jgi:starch-binding outer membrane protein, SusD/RagB family
MTTQRLTSREMTSSMLMGSRARRVACAVALLTAAAGCTTDDILTVEDVDVARPEAVSDSTALPALINGALGDFGVAFNGNGDFNQVTLSGLLSDELINTETFPTRIEVDQRRQQYQSNGSLSGLFYTTQQARAAADRAADGYRRFLPTNPSLAEALNLSALTVVLLAENYCGAVPLSRDLGGGSFEYSPPLTTDQLLQRAVQKADSAIAAIGSQTGAAATAQLRLARIVKARALLNLNQPAQAAAAIGGEAGVPTTYQYIYKHSETSGRQNNGTWNVIQNSGRFGVSQIEGVNGLPFRVEGDTLGTIKDPRVPSVRRPTNGGFGFDNSTPMWWQLKHAKRDTLSIVADGVEARLIEAEAALQAGNYDGALTILNALRANTALMSLRGYGQNRTLSALTPVTGQAARVDQLFKERAYWLFLTAHRLGDLRRLIRQYGRSNESVFPTGTYHKAGTYGTDVNSPIPQAEENNPEFNRAACVTTKA